MIVMESNIHAPKTLSRLWADGAIVTQKSRVEV